MDKFFEDKNIKPIISQEDLLKYGAEMSIIAPDETEIAPSTLWGIYAHYISQDDLDEVYSACYSYYVSLALTGMGLSATAEELYFKDLLDIVYVIYQESDNAEEFMSTLLDFFKSEGIKTYEKKAFQHNALVNKETKDAIKTLGNGNISKGLNTLLNNPQHLQTPTDYDDNIKFYCTWSEEKQWNNLEGDSDTDKLQTLCKGV